MGGLLRPPLIRSHISSSGLVKVVIKLSFRYSLCILIVISSCKGLS